MTVKGTKSADPFYSSGRWQGLRAKIRAKAYKCALCGKVFEKGELKVVDHVIPRRLRPDLAYEPNNLVALHKLCHDSTKARIEKGKEIPLTGPDGWPEP